MVELFAAEVEKGHAASLRWRVADIPALEAADFVNPTRDQIHYTPEDPHMDVRGMAQLQNWISSCGLAAVWAGSESLVSVPVVQRQQWKKV